MWYEMKREFIDAAARVMWADAWATHMEDTCSYCDRSRDAHAETVADGTELDDCPLCLGTSDPEEHDAKCVGNSPDDDHAFHGVTYPGEELTEIAPPTPDYARLEAAVLLGKLESANRADLARIVGIASVADHRSPKSEHERCEERDCTFEVDVAEFASDVAMMALGHGVSWFDDHERFTIDGRRFTVPSIEFTYEEED